MRIESSALVSGREALHMGVNVGFGSTAFSTGGGVNAEMKISASMSSEETRDTYEYRHISITPKLCSCAEVRDADGRLIWAEDDCHLGPPCMP